MKLLSLTSALCCALLAGCNATDVPPDNTKTERVRIDSLHFKDAALERCVKGRLKVTKDVYVDEMKALYCVAGPKEFNNDLKNLIYSLDGLEQLYALETFDAESNAIERANLSGLKNLKKLNLDGNPLAQLDVSNNTQLTELEASSRSEYLKTEAKALDLRLPKTATLEVLRVTFPGANPGKLDVRGLTGLKALTAYSVSELLLADKLSLIWLTASGPLAQLDLSSIQTANLEIHSEKLRDLDLSAQRELKTLYLTGGPKTLDLTANAELTELRLDATKFMQLPLSENHPLRLFSATNVEFTTLDFSNLPHLEEVTIHAEKLRSLSGLNFKKIKYFSLTGAPISHFGMDSCEPLLSLNLSIPASSIDLSGCKNLEDLTLNRTDITQLDASNNLKLTTLNLSENPIAPHLLKLPNQLMADGAHVYNPGCELATTVGCANVPPAKQDTDSLVRVYPSCTQATAAGWCRESHGQYLFAPAPTAPTSSSSTSSSSSGLSSSSSSGSSGGTPSTPDFSFVHAPSVAWVKQANWQFEPGAYKRVTGNYFTEQISNLTYPSSAVTEFMTASPFNQRGKIYKVSVQVKLDKIIRGAKTSLTLVDNIIVPVGAEQIQTRDITLDLDTRWLATSDWVTFSGQFEFWGSSGLTLHVRGEYPFTLKDLTANLVGEGNLTGNPIIPGRN